MQKVAILYDASQAVLSTFELDEVLQQILAIVRDYFHLQSAAILLLDDQRRLYPRSHYGSEELEGAELRLPIGQGITGIAAAKMRPIYVPDVTKDARYVPFVKNTLSELAIPLIVRDEVVGVLDCQSDQRNFFDGETIDLLRSSRPRPPSRSRTRASTPRSRSAARSSRPSTPSRGRPPACSTVKTC